MSLAQRCLNSATQPRSSCANLFGLRTCSKLRRSNTLAMLWNSPDPRQGPEPPFSGKRVSGSQNPHFPSPSHGLEKGVFGQKILHFPCVPLQEKGGFLTENSLSSPGRAEMGVFGPRNPLFQKMGVRGSLWGRGSPTLASQGARRAPNPGSKRDCHLSSEKGS